MQSSRRCAHEMTSEVLGFHQVLLRALIELLRMQHRLDRFDYGWRYVENRSSKRRAELIERYAFVAYASELQRLSATLAKN